MHMYLVLNSYFVCSCYVIHQNIINNTMLSVLFQKNTGAPPTKQLKKSVKVSNKSTSIFIEITLLNEKKHKILKQRELVG